jgi:hypothetical protein
VQGANAAVVGILGAALSSPVFTSAIGDLRDFALALAHFVLLVAWRAPPQTPVGWPLGPTTHSLVTGETYVSGLPDLLGDFRSRSLLILDDLTNLSATWCEPASGTPRQQQVEREEWTEDAGQVGGEL